MPEKQQTGQRTRRFLLWSIALLAILFPVYTHLREARANPIRTEDVEHATTAPTLDGRHPCLSASISASQVATHLGRCSTPVGVTAEGNYEERFEVDLRYGTFVLRQTDLHLTDVFDLPLTRSYLSQDWATSNGEHAFGRNTSHPYDIAPLGTRAPYTWMMLVLEDGDFLYFKRISEGTGFADAVYMHTETSTPFYKATVAWNGDGWTLRLTDGSTMRFPEAYKSKNLAQGAALERTNAAGDRLLLHRDKEGNLQELLTPHHRRLAFEYDDSGRITRAQDDQANWAKYTYNDLGMLIHVVNSSALERRYEYDGVQMTAVIDEHGNELVRNTYNSGILVGQHYRNGEDYRFDYVWNKTQAFAKEVVVTLPDKSQRTFSLEDSVPESIRNQ